MSKTQVSVRLDDGLLAQVDALADPLGWTRSQTLSALASIGLRAVSHSRLRADEILALAVESVKSSRRSKKRTQE